MINSAARILEICIEETAIKLSNIAADRGHPVTETDILWAVEHDPQGATAKAFHELFRISLREATKVLV